ncbi:MAG TPA: hypothetical protein VFV86_06135, partial [Nitrososphaeraceae archaeon]|nr:hypothetical protein [Nitrososphaeraceae archaeon]
MKLLFIPIIAILVFTISSINLIYATLGNGDIITINPGAFDNRSQNSISLRNTTVPVNSTIMWINNDMVNHQIVSGTPEKGPSNIFYGDLFGPRQNYSIILNSPGLHEYYDPMYSHIRGHINVILKNSSETADAGNDQTTGNVLHNITQNNDIASIFNVPIGQNNNPTDSQIISNSFDSFHGSFNIPSDNTSELSTNTFKDSQIAEFIKKFENPSNDANNASETRPDFLSSNFKALNPNQNQPNGDNIQQLEQRPTNFPKHNTIDSFIASGKINSNLVTVSSPWHTYGDWILIVKDGEVKNFTVNMNWQNGTSGHTHKIMDFESDDDIELPGDNIVTINGEADIDSNGKISWEGVDSAVTLGGSGKVITINLNHEQTDHHFAG